jgi:hypothetical protein
MLRICLLTLLLSAAFAHAQAVDPTARNVGGSSAPVTTPPAPAPVTPTIPPAVLPPVGAATLADATGETTVTLDIGFGIRAVQPSRVAVPTGERLRIIVPDMGTGVTYTWTKNGRAIEGASGNVLLISYVTSSDVGTYACLFSTPTGASSQSLVLGVGPTDRLLNLSTRTTIGGGADQGLVSGFVVEAGAQPKKLILRAIGPSLAMFGVTTGVRAPILRIFDSKGQPYTNGYVYPAVVGGPTYESDLAESLARTGAFPIPAGTRDAVVMMPFVPGSYTAQLTSGDGTAGTVLLEIYEVP